MTSDYSWLDDEPKEEKQLPTEDNPRRRALIEALGELTPRQQRFIDELHENALDERVARNALQVSKTELSRWKTEGAFSRLLSLLQGVAADDLGLTRAGILRRQLQLADDTRKLVRRRDGNGNEIEEPIDASAARAALSDLAKELGLLDDSQAKRATVRIINLSTRSEDRERSVDAIEVQT